LDANLISDQAMQNFVKRYKRGFGWTLGAILLVLLLIWVLAPFAIKHYLNKRVFDDMGNYTGYVADVDLSLLKGSYVLRDLVLWRKGGNRDIPFFQVEALSISVSWEALWHGSILASVLVDKGALNFLDARKPEDRQSGKGTNWLSVLDELLPTKLHRLEIKRSSIAFKNLDAKPKIDLRATDIEAVVTNLTNVKDENGRRVANASATASLLDGAFLAAEAQFDPFNFNDFVFAGKMHGIHLPQANDFTTHYLNVDFEDGEGELYVELEAVDGKLSGYAKPLFQNVNILSWRQDVEEQKDNPFQLLWEAGLGFFKTLFTNSETKTVATQIDIRGTIDKAEVNSWQAVFGVIKNAFIKAVQSNFDQLTPLTGSDEKSKDSNDEARDSNKRKGKDEK